MLSRKLFHLAVFTAGLILVLLSSFPLPASSATWSANGSTFSIAWPTTIRAGEPRSARLTVQTPPEFPQNAVLTARLEFADLPYDPSGEIVQSVSQTGRNEFAWSIQPQTGGEYAGILWLYLSDSPNSTAKPQALVSRPLELRVIQLGPLPVVWLRWLGIALLALAAVLFIRRL